MNKRTDFIIPECYIDTNLVETLVCWGGCNHQKGCNQVAKIMQEKYADRFAVGMIDADKRRPSYLNEFTEIANSDHLKIFHHKSRPHYIILVHPAADGFILSCADKAQIDMTDYDLSSNLKEFTIQTKNVMSNKDNRFKRLFKAIKETDEIKLLSELLSYFVENTYQSEDDKIVAFFNNLPITNSI